MVGLVVDELAVVDSVVAGFVVVLAVLVVVGVMGVVGAAAASAVEV